MYLAALTCTGDERVLVTLDDHLPIVEVDDNYPTTFFQDFCWLMKVRYKCCMAPESRARYWSPQQECSRVVYENEPSPGPCFYCVITGGVYVEGREEVKARSGEEFCDHLCSLQVQTVTSGRCFTGNVGRGEAAVKCLLKST